MSVVTIQRPRYPALLLSPDGSRDRDGAVTPSVGSDIAVVPGRYGDAWQSAVRTSSASVFHALAGIVTPQAGTVLVRAADFDPSVSSNQYLLRLGGVTSAPTIYLQAVSGMLRLGVRSGESLVFADVVALPVATPFVVAVRWAAGTVSVRLRYDGFDNTYSLAIDPFTHTSFSTISTAYSALNSTVTYESIVVYDEVLADDEVEAIATLPAAWTWEAIGQQVVRPEVVPYDLATYASGMVELETGVYITDRDNRTRVPLDGLELVELDWDIDRAGSKSRVDITTHMRVLHDYMWIAPYQRLIPETGDIIEQQLGHVRLDRPSDMTDGTMDYDGRPKVIQQATGGDIVDDIVRANLTETFYTPPGGNIMADVRYLIQLAMLGKLTPIPIANGSFEEGSGGSFPGWSTGFTGGAAGSFSGSPGAVTVSIPDGKRAFGMTFDTRPAEGYAFALQWVPLPSGVRRLMLSGLYFRYGAEYEGRLSVLFRDDAGNTISNHPVHLTGQHAYQWERGMVVADVPNGAVDVRVYVSARVVASGAGWARPMWDDVRLYGVSGTPLPADRINLPPSTTTASTRIQTTVGDSIGYDAINADRLSAINHHAVLTDLAGRLTTAPARSAASGTPVRTYGTDDYRLVGTVETERAARSPYNHFQAIKEDFTGEGETLYANAYNDDPDDPRSVHNAPLNSAPPVMAQDAVGADELQALADAARDRESESEMLRIRVMPEAALQVHSVIEIADSDNVSAIGRWLVEYMRPGMTPDDPLVELGCRRARRQEG